MSNIENYIENFESETYLSGLMFSSICKGVGEGGGSVKT